MREPRPVLPRTGSSNAYRLLKADLVPTRVLSAFPQKGPFSRPRSRRGQSQDSAPAPPRCSPKSPGASGFSRTALISEGPSRFPQSALPSPHFLTRAWVGTSWYRVSRGVQFSTCLGTGPGSLTAWDGLLGTHHSQGAVTPSRQTDPISGT